MADTQPGQLIVPHGPDDSKDPHTTGAPEPERPTEQPAPEPVPTPTPSPEPSNQAAEQPAAQPSAAVADPEPHQAPAAATEPAPAQEAGSWQFHAEADPTVANRIEHLPQEITWTASEFIAHEKGANWYLAFIASALAATALMYVATKDKFSTAVTLVVAIMFGVVAGRQPRTQQYALGRHGLQVGEKTYHFTDFKTFSVMEEGAIASVILMPLKRFMPALTIYVAPDMENQVVDFLAAYLPFEHHKDDAVDSLLRRIRF